MLNRMIAAIKENALIVDGDTVLVALSGGPDSVALFEGLLRARDRLSFSMCAAHLNHKLRGHDSDEDERFVKKLAETRGVALIVEATDVGALRKRRGGSVEEVAREVRYAFLRKAARKCGARKIALGHNMDDNAETLLMNLIRGAGLKGLSGIPLSRSEGDFVVIRPLLVVSRREILAFLKSENLSYREDLSNLDTSLKRNKIRHELIPLLAKEYNPKIERTLAETARNLAEAQEVVSSAMGQLEKECVRPVSGGVCVKIEPLRAHSRTLWRELFRRVVEREFGVKVERTTLERICQLLAGTRTRRVGVGKDLLASREYDDVLVIRKENQSPFFFEKELPIPCEVFLAPLGVEISLSFAEKGAVSLQRAQPPRGLGEIWQKIRRGEAKSFEEYFDASALRGNRVIVRTRREGDIVQPIGMRGKKKVKELFIDEKVPVTLRDRIPIVCSGGEIMWIAGYRVASKFAVKESTRRVLRLAAKVLYCGSQQYPL